MTAQRLLVAMILLVCAAPSAPAQKPKVRISAWYWLNAAPKTDWQGDFLTMKNLGFTDVVLGWGLDVSAVSTRIPDTKTAIRLAHQAGLGAYLIVWHPYSNSMPRRPDFMQVDSDGRVLDCFDVFNPEWRSTEWKSYLQKLARAYADVPGMAGYIFDDSFAGCSFKNISYGSFEKKAFGEPIPANPNEPRWDAWVRAREGWWEDWARDTNRYIRAVDRHPDHETYVEDSLLAIAYADRKDSQGLDFGRVAKYFSAADGYTMTGWDSSPGSGERAAEATTKSIETVRKLIGPRKRIIYTFWAANSKRKPGLARYPTAEQIRLICQAALKSGVRHLDMYGYRIGVYQLTKGQKLEEVVPPDPEPYRLSGQYPHVFLWDRPEIHQGLADYLLSLNR